MFIIKITAKQSQIFYKRMYPCVYITVKGQMEYKKRLFENSHYISRYKKQENYFGEGNR